MTETPEEVVEVISDTVSPYLDYYSGNLNSVEVAGLILEALQSAGYVVAKPFWLPGEGA